MRPTRVIYCWGFSKRWVGYRGGTHPHSAEFENLKVGLVNAHSFLPEKNRAGIVKHNGQSHQEVDGGQSHNTATGKDNA